MSTEFSTQAGLATFRKESHVTGVTIVDPPAPGEDPITEVPIERALS